MIDWLECSGGMRLLTNIYVKGVFSGYCGNLNGHFMHNLM